MSPSATSTHLPQELVDAVIDELKNDLGSLRACSLVSKPWVYRSRKYLFATVNLPSFLLRKWQETIPTNPIEPSDPHCHVRSLSLYPSTGLAAFCIPETFIDHLSSFTQVSRLSITNTLWEEWTNAFSDRALVARYFGVFGPTLRKLELTRVYLNMVVLNGLLDVLPWLEEILIFSPMMVGEGAKSLEAFPHLREHWGIPEVEESSSVVDPGRQAPPRWIDSVTLLFPPKCLVVGLANLPLRCRELVLAEDFHYTLNLLLDSTGHTLESLAIRSSFVRGSAVTLENCPILREVKTKAPYNGSEMLAYIGEQARLVQTVVSPFLCQVVFLGKWDSSRMTTDWLEPVYWEKVDRELCDLMDRLDEGVKLEVVFGDAASSGGDWVYGVGCEQSSDANAMLLNGVKVRGGVVKVQRAEKLKQPL